MVSFRSKADGKVAPGYSIYTACMKIAALLAAADIVEEGGNTSGAGFLRDIADAWYDAIDELTYISGTPLAKEHGVWQATTCE